MRKRERKRASEDDDDDEGTNINQSHANENDRVSLIRMKNNTLACGYLARTKRSSQIGCHSIFHFPCFLSWSMHHGHRYKDSTIRYIHLLIYLYCAIAWETFCPIQIAHNKRRKRTKKTTNDYRK